MAARIFVGNLPFTVDSDQLGQMFSQAGTVSTAQVVIDRMTGRSRGFGFVEMVDDADTQKAIDTLNGQDIEGRKLVVNLARPREEKPQYNNSSNNRRSGGYGGGRR